MGVHISAVASLSRPVVVPEMQWAARVDEEPRHAFPRVEGSGGLRSLCGRRWSAAYGHNGTGACGDCSSVLRQLVAGRITL